MNFANAITEVRLYCHLAAYLPSRSSNKTSFVPQAFTESGGWGGGRRKA